MRQRLNARSGIEDAVPAMSEDFMQWVIEDRFTAGRPALEGVGVEFRDDVASFEFMKMRILNACHMLLGYPGLLAGYTMVHEALGDARLFRLLDIFVDRDVIPNLEGPSGVSVPDYKVAVLQRFSNAAIGDQLLRIAHDGAAKIPVFHSKTLGLLVARGGDLRREAFFLACFARYLRGRDDQGRPIEVREPKLGAGDRALIESGDPLALLRTTPFAALKLDHVPAFTRDYLAALADMERSGTLKTIEALIEAEP